MKNRKKCGNKWSQVLTGNCRAKVPTWHRNRLVRQYCRRTCNVCGKYSLSTDDCELKILCNYTVASRPIVSDFFYPIGLPPVYSWSSWSRFGSCSSTCGEGVMTSTRACKSTGCIGHHIRTQVCTKPPCHQGNKWFYNTLIHSVENLCMYWLLSR